MTRAAKPDTRYAASWAAALQEFLADGTEHVPGAALWSMPREVWTPPTPERCADVVAALAAHNDRRHGERWVPSDTRWLVDDHGEVVGFLDVRLELNEGLRRDGGHIGYAVRPSRRREGHAAAGLRAGLALLGEVGVSQALVTCDDDNVGSWRTIEGAGGVLEDVLDGKRRYWVPVG